MPGGQQELDEIDEKNKEKQQGERTLCNPLSLIFYVL